MERISVDSAAAEQMKRMAQIPDLLHYVEESRVENPNPQIIDRLKGFYVQEGRGNIDERLAVDEFTIRLLAKSEHGLSTFDLTSLIYGGVEESQKTLMEPIIMHEIWNLEDMGILVKSEDLLLNLSQKVKEQFK